MAGHTKIQTIDDADGAPEYVVLPVAVYRDLVSRAKVDNDGTVPHEVVGKIILEDKSTIRAYREYLGVSQKELAERIGVTQPSLAKMEKQGVKNTRATIVKIAKALGVAVDVMLELED